MGAQRHLVLSPARALGASGTETIGPIEQVRIALADTYEIEADIGHGGMGRVYLARDRWHDRQVAIKVLHPEIAGALGPERFLREIAIASSFLHPNILPLYDSGSAGGMLYYVMPYVQGESLRAKLAREHQLRVDEVIRIAGDVASALDFAHGRGVVHRDVKPENILLTSGRAMLGDFGLAMSAEDGPGPRTLSGYVIGTPAYMSPEQGAPGGGVDGRTDLYALGCVVYEMLAGEPPFAGATDRAVMARHAVDPVPPLRTVRPGIPAELEAAVLRALAKVPADRPTDATRFAASLVTVSGGAAPRSRQPGLRTPRYLPLLGVLLAALLPFVAEPPPASPHATVTSRIRPRVSMSGFANRTGDPALDPLGAVVHSWLTWALTGSGAVELVDSSVPVGRTPVARGRPTGSRTAGTIPADLQISGSYYLLGASLMLDATITDLRSGTVIFAVEPTITDAAHPEAALSHLREQLVGVLAASR
jgi:serine/threonine protein kinase